MSASRCAVCGAATARIELMPPGELPAEWEQWPGHPLDMRPAPSSGAAAHNAIESGMQMHASGSGLHQIRWRKATGSASDGECTEVACIRETVMVRDSKNPHGPMLAFSATQWRTFIAATRAGMFDS